MKGKDQGIWIGEKDLTNDPSFIEISKQEFASLPEALGNTEAVEQLGGNRRDFMKMLGFGVGAAALAASCDIPVKRAIPYTVKPDTIVPGVATYYATTYVQGSECAPILVKTREGRPIKIEGNDLVGYGGTSARAQASVLSLYDTARFKSPMLNGGDATWADVDKKAMEILSGSRRVALVTSSIYSPSVQSAIDAFTAKYNATHVQYDTVSHSALLDANEKSFGLRAIPSYHFDKADVIVSFDADFLGTWGNSTKNSVDFISGRKLKDAKNAKMNRLYQVESHMSLTGSNADNRVLVKPSEQGAAIVALYNAIAGASLSGGKLNAEATKAVKLMAADLKAARGKSLVVCGTNNVSEQVLVNAINSALGNIGTTVDMSDPLMTYKGDDKAMAKLMSDMNSGSIDAIVLMGVNPVYDYNANGKFKSLVADLVASSQFIRRDK
jgi:molybdopterin-containing oxidoreductase family iron-sulfur binding subunit